MMREASASWIGALAAGNDGGHQPTYQRTLEVGQTLDFPDSSTEVLYGEWPFFEFENERFGAAVVVPGTNKLQFNLSRRVKKGRHSLTLTPQSVNFVPGTPVSAGRVSVPKPPKAQKRTSRRARFIY